MYKLVHIVQSLKLIGPCRTMSIIKVCLWIKYKYVNKMLIIILNRHWWTSYIPRERFDRTCSKFCQTMPVTDCNFKLWFWIPNRITGTAEMEWKGGWNSDAAMGGTLILITDDLIVSLIDRSRIQDTRQLESVRNMKSTLLWNSYFLKKIYFLKT